MANTGYTDSFGNSWDGGFNWQDIANKLSGSTPTPTDTNTRGENTEAWTGNTSYGIPSNPVAGYSAKGQSDVPANPAPTANSGYMLSGGSGTFGYHYDPAKGMYVDGQGNPANQAPQPTGYTPNTNPAVPTGYNPYGLSGSGLQSNPAYTPSAGSGFLPQNLNPNFFATPEAAQSIAQQLGGTVVSRNYGVGGSSPDQLFIQLPNGMMVNAGNLLSIYQNPVFQQNQNVMQGEVLKLLNSGLNPDTMQPVQTQGAFSMGPDGRPVYNAGGSYRYPEQTLVPLAQYNAQNTALNRPPVTTGPMSPLSMGQMTGQSPQGQGTQTQYRTQGSNNNQLAQLAQLAQFFQMLTGGQNLLSQQNQGGGDLSAIMPLLLALLGQQEPQGALYRRSQYPRFP